MASLGDSVHLLSLAFGACGENELFNNMTQTM